MSRLVDRSSAKGEKPQSSVVPAVPAELYSAASRIRSRNLFGRFDPGIQHICNPDEQHAGRASDFPDRFPVLPFCSFHLHTEDKSWSRQARIKEAGAEHIRYPRYASSRDLHRDRNARRSADAMQSGRRPNTSLFSAIKDRSNPFDGSSLRESRASVNRSGHYTRRLPKQE